MTDSEVKPPTILSVSIKYSLFYAAVGILLFVVRSVTTGNPFDRNWIWSVLSIALSLAVLVLAHREFKNNGDSYMSYGQGFKIAFLAAFFGGVITVIFMIAYVSLIDTGAMEAFYDAQREQMETQGTPDASIDIAMEWTKKLFWPISLFMVCFMGVIFAAIITIFTQRKNPEPSI